MDDLSFALNNSGIGGYLGDVFLNHLCYAGDIWWYTTKCLFKLYNLLKIEDIYKSKLLILYYKILKLSSPRYFDTFIPKNSAGVFRYPIRNPRWQPPAHRHTYITSTSRYQLAVLLNSINDTHDMMSNVIEHIGIISLLSFKATIKRYLNNKYSYFCSIINCFICKQYH